MIQSRKALAVLFDTAVSVPSLKVPGSSLSARHAHVTIARHPGREEGHEFKSLMGLSASVKQCVLPDPPHNLPSLITLVMFRQNQQLKVAAHAS